MTPSKSSSLEQEMIEEDSNSANSNNYRQNVAMFWAKEFDNQSMRKMEDGEEENEDEDDANEEDLYNTNKTTKRPLVVQAEEEEHHQQQVEPDVVVSSTLSQINTPSRYRRGDNNDDHHHHEEDEVRRSVKGSVSRSNSEDSQLLMEYQYHPQQPLPGGGIGGVQQQVAPLPEPPPTSTSSSLSSVSAAGYCPTAIRTTESSSVQVAQPPSTSARSNGRNNNNNNNTCLHQLESSIESKTRTTRTVTIPPGSTTMTQRRTPSTKLSQPPSPPRTLQDLEGSIETKTRRTTSIPPGSTMVRRTPPARSSSSSSSTMVRRPPARSSSSSASSSTSRTKTSSSRTSIPPESTIVRRPPVRSSSLSSSSTVTSTPRTLQDLEGSIESKTRISIIPPGSTMVRRSPAKLSSSSASSSSSSSSSSSPQPPRSLQDLEGSIETKTRRTTIPPGSTMVRRTPAKLSSSSSSSSSPPPPLRSLQDLESSIETKTRTTTISSPKSTMVRRTPPKLSSSSTSPPPPPRSLQDLEGSIETKTRTTTISSPERTMVRRTPPKLSSSSPSQPPQDLQDLEHSIATKTRTSIPPGSTMVRRTAPLRSTLQDIEDRFRSKSESTTSAMATAPVVTTVSVATGTTDYPQQQQEQQQHQRRQFHHTSSVQPSTDNKTLSSSPKLPSRTTATTTTTTAAAAAAGTLKCPPPALSPLFSTADTTTRNPRNGISLRGGGGHSRFIKHRDVTTMPSTSTSAVLPVSSSLMTPNNDVTKEEVPFQSHQQQQHNHHQQGEVTNPHHHHQNFPQHHQKQQWQEEDDGDQEVSNSQQSLLPLSPMKSSPKEMFSPVVSLGFRKAASSSDVVSLEPELTPSLLPTSHTNTSMPLMDQEQEEQEQNQEQQQELEQQEESYFTAVSNLVSSNQQQRQQQQQQEESYASSVSDLIASKSRGGSRRVIRTRRGYSVQSSSSHPLQQHEEEEEEDDEGLSTAAATTISSSSPAMSRGTRDNYDPTPQQHQQESHNTSTPRHLPQPGAFAVEGSNSRTRTRPRLEDAFNASFASMTSITSPIPPPPPRDELLYPVAAVVVPDFDDGGPNSVNSAEWSQREAEIRAKEEWVQQQMAKLAAWEQQLEQKQASIQHSAPGVVVAAVPIEERPQSNFPRFTFPSIGGTSRASNESVAPPPSFLSSTIDEQNQTLVPQVVRGHSDSEFLVVQTELGMGPMRFASKGQPTLTEQVTALSPTDRRCYKNLIQRWKDHQAKHRHKWFPVSDEWILRFAYNTSRKTGFYEDRAWKSMKKFRKRYITLSIHKMELQLLSKTLFPVPGLRSKNGHSMFYMRPSRYFPKATSTQMIIDNLAYVINCMCETESSSRLGIGFLACMDDWKMTNFDVNYCYQFMMTLQGYIIPVRVQLFLIVNPPSWFGAIWKIMKPMLAPSFRKKVKMIHDSQLPKYLQEGYGEFLPDDMAGGDAGTIEMIQDFIKYRKHVEREDTEGSISEYSSDHVSRPQSFTSSTGNNSYNVNLMDADVVASHRSPSQRRRSAASGRRDLTAGVARSGGGSSMSYSTSSHGASSHGTTTSSSGHEEDDDDLSCHVWSDGEMSSDGEEEEEDDDDNNF